MNSEPAGGQSAKPCAKTRVLNRHRGVDQGASTANLFAVTCGAHVVACVMPQCKTAVGRSVTPAVNTQNLCQAAHAPCLETGFVARPVISVGACVAMRQGRAKPNLPAPPRLASTAKSMHQKRASQETQGANQTCKPNGSTKCGAWTLWPTSCLMAANRACSLRSIATPGKVCNHQDRPRQRVRRHGPGRVGL